MLPIEKLSIQEAQGIKGLLFDLDDTLLDQGRLSLDAYAALDRLARAGLELMAVTGRPTSWGAVLVRLWPVRAVVAENGSVVIYREGSTVRLFDAVSAPERARRHERLAKIARETRAQFPALQLATEWALRVSDVVFDIGEAQAVPAGIIEQAVRWLQSRGFRTTRSSLHLHVTLDEPDKALGALRAIQMLVGDEPAAAQARYAFIGDSENDAPCFSAFATTFAVRNFLGSPAALPRYMTQAERGAGFAEAVDLLLLRRGNRLG